MKTVTAGALLIGFLLLAAGAQAKATMTPVEVKETTVSQGDPARMWTSEDGVLHIRGQVLETIVEGTVSGSNRVVFNLNLDLATGDGTAFGSFTLGVTWGDRSGAFDGRFTGQISGGALSVRYVAEGSGDFDGMKLMGSGTETGPGTGILMHEGVILDPSG